MASADDSMEVMSALSRPFRLGMLYDACSDRILPGVSIWKTEDVTNATRVTLQPNMRYQVAGSQSVSQKTNLLDVSASVKLSFFAGLIEAGGSAHYLKSQTSSHNQSSVTLHYHQTTDFKELMISELAAPQPEVFDMTDATHVVVGLLYGADALMEFQRSVSSEENKQDIEGELNVMIKKIPYMEISGEGKVTMNDEDKEKVQNFNCKFHGDVQVNSIPSTYEGAVQLYQNLPNLLGDNGEKAVPVKVWLYPLSKLNDTGMKMKRMISKMLVDDAEKVMDDFHQARMRINDLLEQSKMIKVEAITKQLKYFQGSLSLFSTVFLSKLSKLIPAIRSGQDKTEEKDMTELLQAREKLGFSGEEMKQWLDQKETEINIVTAYLKSLGDESKAPEKSPNVEIKPPGPELESYLLQPDVRDVFVFSFTSLEYEEPYLEKVKEAPKKLEDMKNTLKHIREQEDPWYMKEDARKALKESKEIFEALQEKAKIISFISDQNYPGASIRLYQNGDLKDRHVTSNVPEPVTREDFLQYSCHFTLDPNTAYEDLHLSEGNRRVEMRPGAQSYPDHPDRFDRCCQVLCREGVSARCYWEVERSGEVLIAVSYKSISRKGTGDDCQFGGNDQSWSLVLYSSSSSFYHNSKETKLPLVASSRIGVYVDHRAGTLAFYSISGDTMTLLHRVHTTFTHTLYPGFGLGGGSSVKLL